MGFDRFGEGQAALLLLHAQPFGVHWTVIRLGESLSEPSSPSQAGTTCRCRVSLNDVSGLAERDDGIEIVHHSVRSNGAREQLRSVPGLGAMGSLEAALRDLLRPHVGFAGVQGLYVDRLQSSYTT